MEVHHHSHHAPGGTHTPGKKKWKLYFWEFFMLFLAVFCGMLAEYQLEHIIEHRREKQYIRSLVRDVELDLASLKTSYNNRKIQIGYLDSARILLKGDYEDHLNDLYFYVRHIARPAPFQYHDRTIQQLKNSGNLRLIRNSGAADSITIYDNERIKTSLVQQDGEAELRRFIGNNLLGEIFDSNNWNDMTDSSGVIMRPVNNPELLTRDKILLNKFSFTVVRLKGSMIQTNLLIMRTIRSAESLIQLLKKEYHLD